MKNEITDRLKKYYAEKFKEHGANSYGVDWGDADKAEMRYHAMFNLMSHDAGTYSVLDVGAGYGGFYDFLSDKVNLDKLYFLGVDVVEEMVDHAKKTFPKADFLVGDILTKELIDKKFDYVVCNGILTQKLSSNWEDMEKYMESIIARMFELCEVGIAFNTMSDIVDFKLDGNFHFPAEKMFKLASSFSRRVKIDHSYPLYEYTTYIYR